MRTSDSERLALDRVGEALGLEEHGRLAETVRALPRLFSDRQALLRAALAPIRGMDRVDVEAVLDAMNGVHMLREFADVGGLGHHVAAEVHDKRTMADGSSTKALAKRLAALPLSTRVALELWAADLWRRHDDDGHWEQEISWLSDDAKQGAKT